MRLCMLPILTRTARHLGGQEDCQPGVCGWWQPLQVRGFSLHRFWPLAGGTGQETSSVTNVGSRLSWCNLYICWIFRSTLDPAPIWPICFKTRRFFSSTVVAWSRGCQVKGNTIFDTWPCLRSFVIFPMENQPFGESVGNIFCWDLSEANLRTTS